MTLFQPKSGVPQWRLIADYMEFAGKGVVVSRTELAKIADCSESAVGTIVHTLNRQLADQGFRLVAVRGKGYRQAEAFESLEESTERRPRWFKNAARRGKEAAKAAKNNSDVSDLDKKRAEDAELIWSENERLARKSKKDLVPLRPEIARFAKSVQNSWNE